MLRSGRFLIDGWGPLRILPVLFEKARTVRHRVASNARCKALGILKPSWRGDPARLRATMTKKKGVPGDDEFAIPDDELEDYGEDDEDDEEEDDDLLDDEEFEEDEELDEDFEDEYDEETYDEEDEDLDDVEEAEEK